MDNFNASLMQSQTGNLITYSFHNSGIQTEPRRILKIILRCSTIQDIVLIRNHQG